jgi:hypothetical protein
MDESTILKFADMSTFDKKESATNNTSNNSGGRKNQQRKRRDRSNKNNNNNNNNKNVPKESLYKTELCRQYAISGQCSYGPRCQVCFAFVDMCT